MLVLKVKKVIKVGKEKGDLLDKLIYHEVVMTIQLLDLKAKKDRQVFRYLSYISIEKYL
jgi:hypothetical protein